MYSPFTSLLTQTPSPSFFGVVLVEKSMTTCWSMSDLPSASRSASLNTSYFLPSWSENLTARHGRDASPPVLTSNPVRMVVMRDNVSSFSRCAHMARYAHYSPCDDDRHLPFTRNS